MEKTWNSGKPFQEWPAYQNYPKSRLLQVTKETRTTFKKLQASFVLVNVSLTRRKRLGINCMHQRVSEFQGNKTPLTEKNTNLERGCPIMSAVKLTQQRKVPPTVKHGGDVLMVSRRTRRLAINYED
ncbi:hypothetical protein ATANTOWER_024318 [Ataeniobius toweri]|uniref:Uncharacterized protein n=1 Tax=Ataeniobius toweri TaxID=208326 RepID=A0ABU7B0K7_9TELE|nr:hypothetical protein [Ataeniobius toweri]